MADEPLYCPACGKESCTCDPDATGPYCETCGVIPAPGFECKFFKEGGRDKMCEPAPSGYEFRWREQEWREKER